MFGPVEQEGQTMQLPNTLQLRCRNNMPDPVDVLSVDTSPETRTGH